MMDADACNLAFNKDSEDHDTLNKWSQFSLVEAEKLLNISEKFKLDPAYNCRYWIVLTHSCDLSRTFVTDKLVEFLPCFENVERSDIYRSDGSDTWHLKLYLSSLDCTVFLKSDEKVAIDKKTIIDAGIDVIDAPVDNIFNTEQLGILKDWLLRRYSRQTLENNIDKALKQSVAKAINEFFENIERRNGTKEYSKIITSVYLDVDEDEKNKSDNEKNSKYYVTVYLVYDPNFEYPEKVTLKNESLNSLEDFVNRLKEFILEKYQKAKDKSDGAESPDDRFMDCMIPPLSVKIKAEDELSLQDARTLVLWNFNYLSELEP